MTRPDSVAALADMRMFAGLDAAQIAALRREAQLLPLVRGKALFRQEEPAHAFFLLLEGRLRVTRVTPDGQQVVVRFINPGEVCGIAMAMGRTTYPATSEIVVDGAALSWPIATWPRLVERFPALPANMLHTIGNRLQEAQTRVVEMSTAQVEQRVARALLRLAESGGRATTAGVEIDFPLSRQDVAEMTGTTLHTVSRILSAWESRGLVDGGRMRVVIRDAAGLRRLADKAP